MEQASQVQAKVKHWEGLSRRFIPWIMGGHFMPSYRFNVLFSGSQVANCSFIISLVQEKSFLPSSEEIQRKAAIGISQQLKLLGSVLGPQLLGSRDPKTGTSPYFPGPPTIQGSKTLKVVPSVQLYNIYNFVVSQNFKQSQQVPERPQRFYLFFLISGLHCISISQQLWFSVGL